MPAIATATAARLQRSVERRWRVTLREPVQEAAVDRHDRAVDVRGLRRREEAHRRCDLLRCPETAGGDRIDDLRRWWPVAAVERAQALGVDPAGSDRVDRDPVGAELPGEGLQPSDDAG